MEIAPHGAWRSELGADLLTGSSVGLGGPWLDQESLYWLESRADQGGRTSLWRQSPDGTRTELTPEHYLRSTVHEYGGGAVAIADGVIAFCDHPSNEVLLLEPGGSPRVLTGPPDLRYGDLRLHPAGRLLLAVREDHRAETLAEHGEPVNSIVALDWETGAESVLVEGADFYDGIAVSPDGRIAWVEWDHPNMPWDQTRIRTAALTTDGTGVRLGEHHTVSDRPHTSAISPAWQDGAIVFLSDESGYWNLHRWRDGTSTALHPVDNEFGTPPWQLGIGDFAVVDADTILCRWLENGVARLGFLTSTGLQPITTAANTIRGLAADHDRIALLAGFPDRPSAIVTLDPKTDTGTETVVRASTEVDLDPALLSVAEPISFGEPAAYAWFYPPVNPAFSAPQGELPPLKVLGHGGPTSFSAPALRLDVQFWTSRGYAVVDVNYSGSTGYGRAYRQRLQGNWGIADVADCVAAAQHLIDRGLVDPARVWIEGGSAGGYTTLRALTSTDFFAAGISHYGIGDLGALAEHTHKFESRYLDGLVGPWPAARAIYEDRSPVQQLDRLNTPMLILQGAEDEVVPPEQAYQMADAVREKGLPVALVVFDGEAHGFRRADSIRRTLAAEQSFLGQVFGFTPADPVPRLAIDNL
ncbi:peptidase [Enemella evansiae]|uniref:S9 family peptidase n=1 Tax=Enemella evansiae TaxID=2016499 RepID=UPI000B9707BA|nr:prolyl oligopeptidase family serine peptidase [Enemella evansiae]OYO00877.1 peptidase [Enemella evansiae]